MHSELSNKIKAEARRLGFFACGIARAEAVSEAAATRVRHWLDSGGNADMAYMANHTDLRLDPRLLMPGVKSIVCVALNYAPAQQMPAEEYQLAAYALGQDYHDIVKQKLHLLAATLSIIHPSPSTLHYRAFCDSAPVLERYWAEQAGLGWTGRNHQLIIPGAGSMFFLGELFLNIELSYDRPMTARCGMCRACIDACPTGALQADGFRAEHCLSYQLIENRGELSAEAKQKMGNTIYGCDRCQQACPWNRFAQPTDEPRLQPHPELMAMRKSDWQQLSIEDYRRLFKGSAVKRAKYEGLMRNILSASQNDDATP
ncbi:MAG: tRNA epoxyqueuosine(34) reductase QueG [Prevotella sp.]|nr:tRNA epoxyqueuosine(34) reductase QueG [Prevotella sp.]